MEANELTLTIALIGAGAALLIFGRKLFWLIVGGSGFLVAATFATRVFENQPQSAVLVIGLAVGVLGAIIAILMQKIAIGLAGFLAGGYGAFRLLQIVSLSNSSQLMFWGPLIIGGIIGLVVAVFLFEWALVVLSSLTGAFLILYATEPEGSATTMLFVALFLFGVIVQARMIARKNEKKE